MQIADSAAPFPSRVKVSGPSLVLELSWCIHAAYSDYLRSSHPVLGQLYDASTSLHERIDNFWPDEMHCFTELEVMAHHADILEASDFHTVKARIESTLGSMSADLELASETVDDRLAILNRVAQLKRSAKLRRSYFDLLANIWSFVAPWWETEGVAAVDKLAVETRETLARGTDWHQLIGSECATFLEHLPEIVNRNEHGHPVLLIPCALFGKGLYLDLPGCTVVGFGSPGKVEEARTRTEQVVRPLRVLADPTRLAIFDYLKGAPASVGDIAQAFSLAQPTVSVHIKRLREADLVTASRHGNRLEMSVNHATSENLATELAALLTF